MISSSIGTVTGHLYCTVVNGSFSVKLLEIFETEHKELKTV